MDQDSENAGGPEMIEHDRPNESDLSQFGGPYKEIIQCFQKLTEAV